MEGGLKVVEDVEVGGGEEESDVVLRGESAEVEGDDAGEVAVEDGGEFVDGDPARFVSEGVGELEAGELSVAEFVGIAEQEAGFGESTGGEEFQGIGEAEREGVDERGFRPGRERGARR